MLGCLRIISGMHDVGGSTIYGIKCDTINRENILPPITLKHHGENLIVNWKSDLCREHNCKIRFYFWLLLYWLFGYLQIVLRVHIAGKPWPMAYKR